MPNERRRESADLEDYQGRYLLAPGPESRTGRLVADEEEAHDADEAYLVIHDTDLRPGDWL